MPETPETEQAENPKSNPGSADGGDHRRRTGPRTDGPTTSNAAPVPAPAFDYTDAGVPTLGYLQDKIERRYGNALGGTELAGATAEAQSAAKAQEEREKAAADRLAEIRRSLHPDS